MRTSKAQRRGFTLVELLVVILIIAIVVAIVVPALGGARNVARSTGSQSMLTDLLNACEQFRLDERRYPGYFSALEMGSTENQTRGFTAMENIMLELAGGIITLGGNEPPGVLYVGPTQSGVVTVDVDKIGVPGPNNKQYYSPKGRNYVAQNGRGAAGLQAAAQDNQDYPDMVDMFGNPVIVFVENEMAIGPIDTVNDFAKIAHSGTNDPLARFYWASNAGFLDSTQLGRGGRSQRQVDPNRPHSILGGGRNPADLQNSMVGFLGSTSYPNLSGAGGFGAGMLPSASRGKLVFMSAGPDGYFLGTEDRGARQFANQTLLYERNFINAQGQRFTDSAGQVTTIDITEDFDDILVASGN